MMRHERSILVALFTLDKPTPRSAISNQMAKSPLTISLSITCVGAVRLNSILPVCAPGQGGAPLFLLMNRHRAGQVLSPKMA